MEDMPILARNGKRRALCSGDDSTKMEGMTSRRCFPPNTLQGASLRLSLKKASSYQRSYRKCCTSAGKAAAAAMVLVVAVVVAPPCLIRELTGGDFIGRPQPVTIDKVEEKRNHFWYYLQSTALYMSGRFNHNLTSPPGRSGHSTPGGGFRTPGGGGRGLRTPAAPVDYNASSLSLSKQQQRVKSWLIFDEPADVVCMFAYEGKILIALKVCRTYVCPFCPPVRPVRVLCVPRQSRVGLSGGWRSLSVCVCCSCLYASLRRSYVFLFSFLL